MAIWLNEVDVRAVLPMHDLIDCMETALTAFSGGRVRQPVRQVIEAGSGGNFFAAMPAWLETGPAMGAKLVTVYHANGSIGLPTHQAVIVLLDGDTGALLSVMDGRYITEARTAAVSAVALRRLQQKDRRPGKQPASRAAGCRANRCGADTADHRFNAGAGHRHECGAGFARDKPGADHLECPQSASACQL